jgi:multiple sugar transport system substrate-binding protein
MRGLGLAFAIRRVDGGDVNAKTEPAVSPSQLPGHGSDRCSGASRHRQCSGENGGGMVIQGFAEEEDTAFKKIVADYEKASGNTIDFSIIPYAPMRQKIVSAVTSGTVPDLFQSSPVEAITLFAWDGKLVDVTDVVDTQREEYSETALLSAYYYNSKEKKRSFYGVPYTTATLPNHIWRPLVEKAGLKMEDIPKTWDAYYEFFKEVQKKLRDQRMRNVYGLGFQLTTNGNDPITSSIIS